MRLAVITLFVCALIISSACNSQSTNQPTSAPSAPTSASPLASSTNQNPTQNPTQSPDAAVPKGKVDACTLLTSNEIQAVQGEALKETKPTNRATGDFLLSQCYYELPTQMNSISLSITEINPANQNVHSLKDFWETTFGKDEGKSESDRKKEREKEKSKPRAEREGEEEESAPMEPVRGVGDEAFWSANSVGGVLYVLKRDRFIRISVGGKGDAEAKLKRSKALAQKAVRRL